MAHHAPLHLTSLDPYAAAGTSIVTLADSKDAQHPGSAAGDALCVLSAVFYACYTVAIKKMLRGDEETNMILFFGYVGLINLLGLAPVLVALQVASLVNVAQLTAGMFFLVVAKGVTLCSHISAVAL